MISMKRFEPYSQPEWFFIAIILGCAIAFFLHLIGAL